MEIRSMKRYQVAVSGATSTSGAFDDLGAEFRVDVALEQVAAAHTHMGVEVNRGRGWLEFTGIRDIEYIEGGCGICNNTSCVVGGK